MAFTEQIEKRRALREIVVRVGGPAVPRVQRPAQAEKLTPSGWLNSWIEDVGGGRQPLLGLGHSARVRQRFGGDEGRLERIERRRAGAQDFVRPRHRVVEAPCRSASLALSTRTDHSYHWLV